MEDTYAPVLGGMYTRATGGGDEYPDVAATDMWEDAETEGGAVGGCGCGAVYGAPPRGGFAQSLLAIIVVAAIVLVLLACFVPAAPKKYQHHHVPYTAYYDYDCGRLSYA